mmetsp:Transcript_27611/g.64787  ORF Transcript_27611/g.64787 Transcript_27611/m.64787 type:complete len:102 (-) Transcript_27611:13-318(-)
MYSEAHPSRLLDHPGAPLFGSIYANVPDGQDCDKGTFLARGTLGSQTLDTAEVFPKPCDEYATLYDFPGQAYPQTSNGRIGRTTFSIDDPFSFAGDRRIWF